MCVYRGHIRIKPYHKTRDQNIWTKNFLLLWYWTNFATTLSTKARVKLSSDIKIKTTYFAIPWLRLNNMRKTTRLKSGWGFGQKISPLSTARVLIDAVGLCLLRVSEVWRLFAPDLRRWINSFSGSDFKPRLVYKTWYFCYFFTNFGQQFLGKVIANIVIKICHCIAIKIYFVLLRQRVNFTQRLSQLTN